MLREFLDALESRWAWIIGITVVVLIWLAESGACAKCISHQVTKGETLTIISKEHFGDKKYWKDIKYQNNLKDKRLKIGQRLGIYVPDATDWHMACEVLVHKRLEQLGVERPDEVAYNIASGVQDMNLGTTDPLGALEQCRWAIVTAHQESLFEFAIGGAGEVSMYQFKLDTVRLTGKWYNIDQLANGSDYQLVRLLLSTRQATKIFLLHYRELYRRYKSLWMAWKRYNNGSEATAYASKAMKRYKEVRKLQPVICKP